jgi:DNA-binding transcriptional MerR regulator
MSASALPSKLFFRIGEVASLVGVEPHVLRYWEREFRSIRPTKSAKGQRVYSRKDVENLLRVRDLLYRDGFTIAGAKKRLQRGVVLEPQSQSQSHAELEALRDADADASESHPSGELETETENESETEEEAAVLGEPASGPRNLIAHADDEVRAKLTALRLEVEGFLDELESGEQA